MAGYYKNTATVRFGFEQKWDADGNALWRLSRPSSESHAICTDADGNVIVTGHVWETVNFFFPESGELHSLTSSASADPFIMKINQLDPVSTSHPEFPAAVLLYPNPSDDAVHIELDKSYETLSVSILTLNGLMVAKETFRAVQQVDLHLPETAGLYLLSIETSSGKSAVFKIKKE